MSEYCIVVAGGAEARIFTLQAAEPSQLPEGPRLVELAAPLAAEPKPAPAARAGRTRGPRGGMRPYGGHQQPHREDERKFARDLAAHVRRMIQDQRTQHLVVCAEKRLLGTLRPNLNEALGSLRLRLHEIPKDLHKLSPHQLQRKLAREGYLPRRRTALGV